MSLLVLLTLVGITAIVVGGWILLGILLSIHTRRRIAKAETELRKIGFFQGKHPEYLPEETELDMWKKEEKNEAEGVESSAVMDEEDEEN